MERSRDPLVPGGNTTRYQRLDIGTGWCYHPVLMDPFTLVPGENITRYLCLAFGTGWWLPPGTKSASQVTSKGKYLRLSHNCVVDEVVKEIHLRQEVTGSNPSHCNVLLFSFDAVQGTQRYRVIHPVPMARAIGPGCLVPVVRTGTKGHP